MELYDYPSRIIRAKNNKQEYNNKKLGQLNNNGLW